MRRQTKIIVTLGPASCGIRMLEGLIRSGIDVVRINFSHGSSEEHRDWVERVRTTARQLGRPVAVLGDLQGPKIRIGGFRDGPVELARGASFVLDAGLPDRGGDARGVGLTYKGLSRDVAAGDVLVLDDGRVEVKVTEVDDRGRIHTRVLVGGPLSDHKGINRRGGGLSAGALTDKDRADVRLAADLGVDYLAVSFPRARDDLDEARELLREAGGGAGIVAKIERAEALDVIDDLIEASDAIMVARGDLGVEIGDEELPGVQKRLVERARQLDCVVITATQMMESMVENIIPTRAEVMDVANAVLDGTDAVMLSAETAVGRYPVQVVRAMDRICQGAERHYAGVSWAAQQTRPFQRIDEAISKAAVYTANFLDARAIVALTESGYTALMMSRVISNLPVYAITRNDSTARRMALYRDVHPVLVDWQEDDINRHEQLALQALVEQGAVEPGDAVIITHGARAGVQGGTNAMKILQVPGASPAV